jgi:two-component system, sporulation sensor kinase E
VTVKTYHAGDETILAVADTGPGVPKEVLGKLGTPFLTTKENGTGLGLAVCYRIAQRRGARIEVKTSAKDTTFFVKFKAGLR